MNSVSQGIQSCTFRHALAFPYFSHSVGLGRVKNDAESADTKAQYAGKPEGESTWYSRGEGVASSSRADKKRD